MPPKTEAWWVCTGCNTPIARPRTNGFQEAMIDHKRVCLKWGFRIKQIVPQKRSK